jgi:hypothetical protein
VNDEDDLESSNGDTKVEKTKIVRVGLDEVRVREIVN